jgi:hypothetical protein
MARGTQSPQRLLLQTSQAVFEKGALRQVIVEVRDGYAVLRLRGMKDGLPIPWTSVYHLAAAQAAERELRARRGPTGRRAERLRVTRSGCALSPGRWRWW